MAGSATEPYLVKLEEKFWDNADAYAKTSGESVGYGSQVQGCDGVARIDFMIDEATDNIYVNEINTIPGSLSFYLWEATGVSFTELTERLIDIAFRSYELMAKTNTVPDTEICDIVIRTDEIARYKAFNLKQIRQVYESGYRDTMNFLLANGFRRPGTAATELSTTDRHEQPKPVIYQLLPRLFTNTTHNCVPNGTYARNGSGKLNDYRQTTSSKASRELWSDGTSGSRA